MVKFKLKRIFDKFCRVFIFGFLSCTLLFFTFIPCFASSPLQTVDLYSLDFVPSSSPVNYVRTRQTVNVNGQTQSNWTRFTSSAGSAGIMYLFDMTNFIEYGQNYKFIFKFRPNSQNASITMSLCNIPRFPDATSSQIQTIADFQTSDYTSGSVNDFTGSFSPKQSICNGNIYFIFSIVSGSNNTVTDFSPIQFFNTDEFAGTWDKESIGVTDVNIDEPLQDFEDNGNTLLVWLTDFKNNDYVLRSIRGVGELMSIFFGDLSENMVPLYLTLLFGGCLSVVIVIIKNVGAFNSE